MWDKLLSMGRDEDCIALRRAFYGIIRNTNLQGIVSKKEILEGTTKQRDQGHGCHRIRGKGAMREGRGQHSQCCSKVQRVMMVNKSGLKDELRMDV